MNEEQPEPELSIKGARSKLKALAELARQLRIRNVFRLSAHVLKKIRGVLRVVLQHDDYVDDTSIAQLLGVICTAAPDQRTELPLHLAEEFRAEFESVLAEDKEEDDGDDAQSGEEDDADVP